MNDAIEVVRVGWRGPNIVVVLVVFTGFQHCGKAVTLRAVGFIIVSTTASILRWPPRL
ncbi:hypothetical protein Q5N24_002785 [Xanthomonas vasicola]|uniref:hypothetical protein n=1 Tax=Xanthomonas vasicola TaxID=56459 RepID=UPI00155A76B3|nr:hypothetical protein [Xanthomonas vasicola]MDO6983645.1 hypothetical protein [Xanthomonas vasicola]